MKSLLRLSLGLLMACGCSTSRNTSQTPDLSISEFTFPWSSKSAPRTEFRASIVDDRLHFSFDVEDHDLVVSDHWHGESTLDGEDRVEIFFARDPALEHYYCIEIDPLGRVHDYAASHYRKFDSGWNCPGLKTSGHRTENGFRVEGSLPLASLEAVLGKPVHSGSVLRLGLFRAEFYGTGATARGEADDNWLSWVRPTPKTPDFHVPSGFQEIRLP